MSVDSVLTPAECRELLEANHIGRLAVSVGTEHRPLIRPVTYAFDERSSSVVFRSDPGSKLHALLSERYACFEIDGADDDALWSVIVKGIAEPVIWPGDITRFDALHLTSAVPLRHPRWLRIHAQVTTGRRFRTAEVAMGDPDVRR
jgi:nitroimidazol reductase NimA-like FMN-containing flavoprotein (pyridoxamine 5'-phosphate oxidase superfamily)